MPAETLEAVHHQTESIRHALDQLSPNISTQISHDVSLCDECLSRHTYKMAILVLNRIDRHQELNHQKRLTVPAINAKEFKPQR